MSALTAATFKDMHDGAKFDLMIAVAASLTLIVKIILLLTRSPVAALVSVLISSGEILFGIKIRWIAAALSVVILLVVGFDYNLVLVSRLREEIHARLRTAV
jgi:putative drug exporter of the RND superfamily